MTVHNYNFIYIYLLDTVFLSYYSNKITYLYILFRNLLLFIISRLITLNDDYSTTYNTTKILIIK